MAEFAATGDSSYSYTAHYTAIEKAYCEDRWSDVLEQGNQLLERLPAQDLSLRQRLQLLLAHTHLYGYGNRESAQALYQAVHESQAESALRQIAAQGLQQCTPPAHSPGEAVGLALAAQSHSAEPQAQPQAQPQTQPGSAVEPDPSDHRPRPVEDVPLLEETGPSLHEAAQALSQAESGPTAPAVAPVMPWLEASPTGDSAATPTEAAPEALIAEVIDEPELLEVHQADPALAEELEIREATAAPPSVSQEDRDQDLRSGLLRVEIL